MNELTPQLTDVSPKPCRHDLNNAIRKGRATYVCPKCGEDISLLMFLTWDAKIKDLDWIIKPSWQSIASAPRDGTRFLGRTVIPSTYINRLKTKRKIERRVTRYGKVSHVPIYGWCYGGVEDVDLWEPTHWKPF